MLPGFEIQHFCVQGDLDRLRDFPAEKVSTRIVFVIPDRFSALPLEVFHEEKNKYVISIERISRKEGDPIRDAGAFNAFGSGRVNEPALPFDAFTDNRGEYPALFASVTFSYRMASWLRPTSEPDNLWPPGMEDMDIAGLPIIHEKLEALKAFNHLAKDVLGPTTQTLRYDEVHVFLEQYFETDTWAPILRRLSPFTGRDSHKLGVAIYYLGKESVATIKPTVSEFRRQLRTTCVDTETDLADAVFRCFSVLVTHYVEARRWVEPFWDGERKDPRDPTQRLPRTPKREPQIQHALLVLLEEMLHDSGIHIARETNEGAGVLDFRCFATNAKREKLTIGVELKLAHNKQLRHGIERQLPEYLRAIDSRHGVFVVLWFKDETGRIFNEPRDRDLNGLRTWLAEESALILRTQGLRIAPVVIDASVRSAASKD